MHNPLFRIEVLHNVVLVISYSMQERGNLFHGHYSRAEPFKKYHRSFKTISSCHTSITRRGAAFYQKMHFFCQKSFEGNLGTLCLKISQEVSSSEASYVLKKYFFFVPKSALEMEYMNNFGHFWRENSNETILANFQPQCVKKKTRFTQN